jgi:hypothetical protein
MPWTGKYGFECCAIAGVGEVVGMMGDPVNSDGDHAGVIMLGAHLGFTNTPVDSSAPVRGKIDPFPHFPNWHRAQFDDGSSAT